MWPSRHHRSVRIGHVCQPTLSRSAFRARQSRPRRYESCAPRLRSREGSPALQSASSNRSVRNETWSVERSIRRRTGRHRARRPGSSHGDGTGKTWEGDGRRARRRRIWISSPCIARAYQAGCFWLQTQRARERALVDTSSLSMSGADRKD